MAIDFQFFGFKCDNCGAQWDIGDVTDALTENAALRQELKGLRRQHDGEFKSVTRLRATLRQIRGMPPTSEETL